MTNLGFLVAAIGDDLYNVAYYLHILAVVVGAGAAFMVPVMGAVNRSRNEPVGGIYEASRLVVAPSLLLAGIVGAALVGFSDDVYDFSQGWLSAAFGLWIVMLGICGGLLWPVERKLASGEGNVAALQKRAAMGYGIIHLLIAVELGVMIWGSS